MQSRFGLGGEEMCKVQHIVVPYFHLVPCQPSPQPCQPRPRHTACRSKRFCSFHRCTFLLVKRSAFLCSLSSSSCFRWACCLFSISDRRFCPAVVGFCDNAPSTAPNNLRSLPLSLLFGAAGLLSSAASSPLVRARFTLSSVTDDCRLLSVFEGEAGGGGASSGSGSTTAEAIGPLIALHKYQIGVVK